MESGTKDGFTKGPWIVEQRFGAPFILGDGSPVAQVTGYHGELAAQANAALIAASPSMLGALEGCLAAMDCMASAAAGDMTDADNARLWNAAVEQAEEVIAAARTGSAA